MNATSFNQPLGSWDISQVNNISSIFSGATSFNQPLNSWNISNVTSMANMFQNATSFNQDISSWNVSKTSQMDNMFNGATALSTTNYDALLLAWSAQPIKNGVKFSAGTTKYSLGSPATARSHMIDNHNWNITDGGSA